MIIRMALLFHLTSVLSIIDFTMAINITALFNSPDPKLSLSNNLSFLNSTVDWSFHSDIRYKDDLLVVAAWTAMGTFGFVTNVLILVGILHTKKLYQSTSYWLIISLSVCDMAMILICLCHLSPATVLHDNYVSLTDFTNAFGIFMYDGFWYTGVLHLMVMAINRYISICQPKYYIRFFSHQKTTFIIGFLYLLGIVVAIPGLFKCCYLVFNTEYYAVQYEPADTSYQFVDMAINGSSIIIMVFCYSCIVIRVRRSRIMLHQYRKLYKEQRTLQTKAALVYATARPGRGDNISAKFARLFKPNVPIISRREVRLFFQFATVSFIFLASVATWGWLPQLSESKWVGFVVTSLFFLNNSTNPTIYLIFNSILRRQIQRVLCPFRASVSSSRTSRRPQRKTVFGPEEGEFGHRQIGGAAGTVAVGACFLPTSGNRGGSAFLQRLRQSTKKETEEREDGSYFVRDYDHRRSTLGIDEDENRLLRTRESCDYNDTTDNMTNNATCNLMAMAAFLNTTTVTGRVLMKTMQDEESNATRKRESVIDSIMQARKHTMQETKIINPNNENSENSRSRLLASKENSAIESSGILV